MTSPDGTFDFTISSSDSNLPAREYCEPIIRRYVERHRESDSAILASAFLYGMTTGMLGFLEPGDAIYFDSLASPIPDAILEAWRNGHQDGINDPQIDIEGPRIYKAPWYNLWYSARNDLHYYRLMREPMPEPTAVYYAGWAYGRQIVRKIPQDRYDEIMSLLSPFMRQVDSFQADLKFEPAIIERLRIHYPDEELT